MRGVIVSTPGSARASRAGNGALATANLCASVSQTDKETIAANACGPLRFGEGAENQHARARVLPRKNCGDTCGLVGGGIIILFGMERFDRINAAGATSRKPGGNQPDSDQKEGCAGEHERTVEVHAGVRRGEESSNSNRA